MTWASQDTGHCPELIFLTLSSPFKKPHSLKNLKICTIARVVLRFRNIRFPNSWDYQCPILFLQVLAGLRILRRKNTQNLIRSVPICVDRWRVVMAVSLSLSLSCDGSVSVSDCEPGWAGAWYSRLSPGEAETGLEWFYSAQFTFPPQTSRANPLLSNPVITNDSQLNNLPVIAIRNKLFNYFSEYCMDCLVRICTWKVNL